jgi:hypothetical protein
MKNKPIIKSFGSLIGMISLSISLVILLLILSWIFELTSFQKFGGIFLLIAPLVSVIGFILALISHKKTPNKFSKCGIISNAILFILPFLYWTIGTLVFGP